MKTYRVEISYYDKYCRNGKWSHTSYTSKASSEKEAVDQAIKWFGLGVDCEYRIDKVIVVD